MPWTWTLSKTFLASRRLTKVARPMMVSWYCAVRSTSLLLLRSGWSCTSVMTTSSSESACAFWLVSRVPSLLEAADDRVGRDHLDVGLEARVL